MNSIIPFAFEGKNVRVTDRNGEPWFVLTDVCRTLGLANPSMVAANLDADEKETLGITESIGNVASSNVQQLIVVSEPGLYRILALSRKPEAKRFDRWIRHEVLPSIRKTGSYGTPAAIDYSDPKILLGVMQRLQADVEAKDRKIEADAPKVKFVERHANGEGCFNLQTASQHIGLPPNKLGTLLEQHSYLHRQNKKLRPYAPYTKYPTVYFYLKAITLIKPDGETEATFQTMVTPKGLQVFAEKFGKAPHVEVELFADVET